MPDRLARALVTAAMEVHRRRLWTTAPADAPFLVRVPGDENPLAAVLIGQAMSDYGLILFRGEDAFGSLVEALGKEVGRGGMADVGDILGVTFEPLASIPAEVRPVLSAAGFSARREQVAPHIMVKHLGRRPRLPNRSEMRLMTWTLVGILAADDAGELRPRIPDTKRRRVLEVRVGGELRHPTVTTAIVPWPSAVRIGEAPALFVGEAELTKLPRIDGLWIAALAPLPGLTEDDESITCIFLVADEQTERIIASRIFAEDDLEPAVARLSDAFLEVGGLPREIRFNGPRLHDALAPALASLGVRTTLGDEPTFLVERIDILQRLLAPGGGTPPSTLPEWKRADRLLTARLHEDVVKKGLLTPRALARYFGSPELAQEVLSQLPSLSPLQSFLEWLIADYRPTQRSKTYVEKLLAKKSLDPVDRALLEARRSAQLSVYRVDSCHPGATLEVEDLLSGDRRIVHDSSMSGCDLEGRCLALRLMQVGEWTFPCFGGPPVPLSHLDRLMELVQSADTGPGGLRHAAELVGQLWRWALEAQRSPPALRNADGDPLEPRTGLFRVDEVPALAEALRARDDVEVDDDGSWIWLRPGAPAPGMGDHTLLGTLELHDDTLVLEVNSARRLERARAWLEQIPGVRFESAREAKANEVPLDDRLPGSPHEFLTPQAREAVTHQFHQACWAWLDVSVPALDDQTPRAACKTTAGRSKVALLIRSMPAMQTPGGPIAPPREEMLRSLGISG